MTYDLVARLGYQTALAHRCPNVDNLGHKPHMAKKTDKKTRTRVDFYYYLSLNIYIIIKTFFKKYS